MFPLLVSSTATAREGEEPRPRTLRISLMGRPPSDITSQRFIQSSDGLDRIAGLYRYSL